MADYTQDDGFVSRITVSVSLHPDMLAYINSLVAKSDTITSRSAMIAHVFGELRDGQTLKDTRKHEKAFRKAIGDEEN